MKKIGFRLEKPITLEYDRNEVKKFLRDKYVQYLIKYSFKKLNLGDFISTNEAVDYVILILNKALSSKLSSRELEKIEYLHNKFEFLPYCDESHMDRLIHMTTYQFVALCNGYKKTIESIVCNLGVTDEEGRKLDFRNGLDWDHSKALRQDVASLTKKCIREFLKELQETGRIMTSAELAEAHKTEIDSSTDNSFSSADNDTTNTDHRNSDSSTSSGDTTNTQDSNNSNDKTTNQRGCLSTDINDDIGVGDKKDKDTDNTAKNELTEESELSAFILNFLAWIYELPEWLQEKMLNSAPVRALLGEAEAIEAIYNQNNYLLKQLTNLFTHDKSTSLNDITEDKQSSKVTPTTLESGNTFELVDTTMILQNPQVTGLILPTMAIGSGNILPNNDFGGLLHFNGLNGLEVF